MFMHSSLYAVETKSPWPQPGLRMKPGRKIVRIRSDTSRSRRKAHTRKSTVSRKCVALCAASAHLYAEASCCLARFASMESITSIAACGIFVPTNGEAKQTKHSARAAFSAAAHTYEFTPHQPEWWPLISKNIELL